jgi:hypothetical protein
VNVPLKTEPVANACAIGGQGKPSFNHNPWRFLVAEEALHVGDMPWVERPGHFSIPYFDYRNTGNDPPLIF